jgi:predicted 2-oxoglutarate/Fe(II)-dependent dioxygenase YbiX
VPEVIRDVRLVSAFVTRYLPGDARFDDHDDLCDVSLVVELSDADYEGGGVVGSDGTPWTDVRLAAPERGSAVIIGRGVSHRTIPMISGVRWAMVVFFYYV